MNKLIPIVSFIVSGSLLLIYPLVFIAGIMSLAAVGGESFDLNALVATLFLILSMSYPITYFASLLTYVLKKNKSNNLEVLLISAPYIHLALTVVFSIIWMIVG
ncbi:MAG: hypothetical protein LAT82_00870 [Nanoarchaeota archaeon]|nr:hypothetical protein [Nanoarchaeota archaeon]